MKKSVKKPLSCAGMVLISQSNAQTSLQTFFEAQGFNDSDSINGVYDLGFYSPNLVLTIEGDGVYKEAGVNFAERFGVWGAGSISFGFNQAVDVSYILDGRNRPGEVNDWTGNGVRLGSFNDETLYDITSNSFENVSEEFLIEGKTAIQYAATFGFTVGLDGRSDQPIDLVADLEFARIPEPSSLFFLGLSGLGFLGLRRRK